MLHSQFVKYQSAMQNEVLIPYRSHLKSHRAGLATKRAFDIAVSLFLIIVTSPLFLFSVLAIALTGGHVFYRQLRVGRNGRELRVVKFRTMVAGADKKGEITVGGDARITGIGRILRAMNYDEAPQLFQVLCGTMSIVGVRPEVPRYVDCYTPEDFATLLLKPGLTSPVALAYRHESEMLEGCADPEAKYINELLPAKMNINRSYVREFSFANDMRIIGRTVRSFFQNDEKLARS